MNLLVFKKYFRVLRTFVKAELMTDLAYRVNFIIIFVGSLFWVIAELAFFHFLLLKYQAIAGWNYNQILLLVGVNQLWIGGCFYLIVWPSLTTYAEMIRTGGLDKILTLPIQTRFYISVFKFDWTSLTMMLQGIIITIYAFTKMNAVFTIERFIAFIALLVLSYWIVYCIQFIVSSSTFWLTKAGSVQYVISALDRVSRLPYEVLSKGILFVVFTLIIPVAIIGNIPARALLGILDLEYLAYGVVSALMLTVVSHIIWKLGVRRYESASS